MNIEKLAIESGVIHVNDNSTYWTENNAIEVLSKFAEAVIKAQKMRKFQVVIEKCVVYEVEAQDEADAEDVARSIYSRDDFNEPFVAEVREVEND